MPEKKDNNKRILYLGLDPSRYPAEGEIVHFPIIKTVPRPFPEVKETLMQITSSTHLLFTSRIAVSICVDYAMRAEISLEKKVFLVLGAATAEQLAELGWQADHIAEEECAEGVVAMLEHLDLTDAHLFFPHSSIAREVIPDYLNKRGIDFTSLPLYDTVPNRLPLPDLENFDEIVFTSPSTVKAFRELFACFPPPEKCRAIGSITENHFNF